MKKGMGFYFVWSFGGDLNMWDRCSTTPSFDITRPNFTLLLAGLELMVFLHQPSKCWVYACEPLLSVLSMESINFSSFLSTALHFICLLSFSFCLQRLYSHRLGKRYRCEGEELLSLRDGKVCFSPIQKKYHCVWLNMVDKKCKEIRWYFNKS